MPPGIAGWTFKPHPQARFAPHVLEQAGFRAVLGRHQIHPAITVEIRNCSATLFTIDHDAALLTWHGAQPARAVAS